MIKEDYKRLKKYFFELTTAKINSLIYGKRILKILENKTYGLCISVTNICSANCSFCAYKYQSLKKGRMPFETYKKVVVQYSEFGGGGITLTPVVGDPLVDQDIINKIRFARSIPNITWINLDTNLIRIDNFSMKELLTSGITTISISTCLSNRQDYKELFGVDKYDKVSKNIEKLIRINRHLGEPVKIEIDVRTKQFLSEKIKSEEYKRIKKLTSNIERNFFYFTWNGMVPRKELPKNAVIMPLRPKKKICWQFYSVITVLWNGDVTVCSCRDVNATLRIGNMHRNSLKEILKGKELKKFKEDWSKGKIPDVCRKCRSYHPYTLLYGPMMFNEIKKLR